MMEVEDISITINGVKYDAVDVTPELKYGACSNCALSGFCCDVQTDAICYAFNLKNKYFIKSEEVL